MTTETTDVLAGLTAEELNELKAVARSRIAARARAAEDQRRADEQYRKTLDEIGEELKAVEARMKEREQNGPPADQPPTSLREFVALHSKGGRPLRHGSYTMFPDGARLEHRGVAALGMADDALAFPPRPGRRGLQDVVNYWRLSSERTRTMRDAVKGHMKAVAEWQRAMARKDGDIVGPVPGGPSPAALAAVVGELPMSSPKVIDADEVVSRLEAQLAREEAGLAEAKAAFESAPWEPN